MDWSDQFPPRERLTWPQYAVEPLYVEGYRKPAHSGAIRKRWRMHEIQVHQIELEIQNEGIIDFHRNNIRAKLGIKNEKINPKPAFPPFNNIW